MTPDPIRIEYRLIARHGGRLEARFSYRILEWLSVSGPLDGASLPATPAAESFPPGEPLPGRPEVFHWDAGSDLAGQSARVTVTLVPIEDGVEGGVTWPPSAAGKVERVGLRTGLADRRNRRAGQGFSSRSKSRRPWRTVRIEMRFCSTLWMMR